MKRLRNVFDDDDDDRISELPEPILHQILSLLPTKDATRTCVLSKTWNSAWNSFPVLDFNQYDHNQKESTQNFLKYVNNSIARRRGQNLTIRRFNLVVKLDSRTFHKSRLDIERWLNYAVSNNIEHLVLHFFLYTRVAYLSPTSALFRAKSLTELDLLDIEILVDPGSCCSFIGLKRLKLKLVYIEDPTLQSWLSNSCSLEEVSIIECYGFQSVSLCSTKLKSVELNLYSDQVEKLTTEAPNLRFLSLGGTFSSVLGSSSFEPFKCNKNLKKLVLHGFYIDDAIMRVIREFRVLEKLELIACTIVLESIRISYHKLSKSAVSDTTIGFKGVELFAHCRGCWTRRKNSFIPHKINGLYKLGII